MMKEKNDYLVLQETRLSKEGMRGTRKRAGQLGWEVVAGKPRSTQIMKNGGSG